MNETALLFAYGTLRDPARLRRLAGGPVRRLGRGRVRGRLRRAGPYPQLVPGGRRWARGEVFRLVNPRWAALDRYEGCPPQVRGPRAYRRRRLPVHGPGGRLWHAWAYVAAA